MADTKASAAEVNPLYEPKTADARLGWLVEECGETLQAAGKILRFGLDGRYLSSAPGNEKAMPTNREQLLLELTDLEHAIRLVREELNAIKV